MISNIKKQTLLEEENWDLIIEPQRHLLDLKLGDLWRYRDLVMLFVRREGL
jgi:lipopolysaccharide transport system permease protein